MNFVVPLQNHGKPAGNSKASAALVQKRQGQPNLRKGRHCRLLAYALYGWLFETGGLF